MSLAAGIYDFLSDTLTVAERVYPLTLPQSVTLPAMTYQLVSETPFTTHDWQQDHALYTGVHSQESRVQFNAYGDTYDAAEELARELEAAITGYRGPWGDVQIESVIPALALDDYDPDIQKWRRITDYFVVWYPTGS